MKSSSSCVRKCNCQALSLQAKHNGINNSYHQDTRNEPEQRKHMSKIVGLLLSLILLSLQHPLLIGNIRSLPRCVSSISVTSVYTPLHRMTRLDCGKMWVIDSDFSSYHFNRCFTQVMMGVNGRSKGMCIRWIYSMIQTIFHHGWQNKYNNLYQATVINTIAGQKESIIIGSMNLYNIFQKPYKLLVPALWQGAPQASWKLCQLSDFHKEDSLDLQSNLLSEGISFPAWQKTVVIAHRTCRHTQRQQKSTNNQSEPLYSLTKRKRILSVQTNLLCKFDPKCKLHSKRDEFQNIDHFESVISGMNSFKQAKTAGLHSIWQLSG